MLRGRNCYTTSNSRILCLNKSSGSRSWRIRVFWSDPDHIFISGSGSIPNTEIRKTGVKILKSRTLFTKMKEFRKYLIIFDIVLTKMINNLWYEMSIICTQCIRTGATYFVTVTVLMYMITLDHATNHQYLPGYTIQVYKQVWYYCSHV